MSILDINDINTELDIEAYYINKIVNFFKKNGYYGDGIGEEYATNSISQRKILKYSYSGKIVASDILDRKSVV